MSFAIFAYLLLWTSFLFLFWNESRRNIFVVPFVILFFFELIRVWPTVFYAESRNEMADDFFVYLLLTLDLMLLVGYMAGKFFFRLSFAHTRNFHCKPPVTHSRGTLLKAIMISVLVLFFLSLYIAQGIPALWLSIFHGPTETLVNLASAQRLAATKGHYFGLAYRGQGIVNTVRVILPAFLISAAVLLHARDRSSQTKLLVVGVSIYSMFMALSIGNRGSMAQVVILSFVTYAMVFRVRLRHVLFGCAFIFCSLVAISAITAKEYRGFASAGLAHLPIAIEDMFFRIGGGNGSNAIRAVEYSRIGYIRHDFGQDNIASVVNALPGTASRTRLAQEVTLFKLRSDTSTTFSSSTWHAIAYVDFGFVGACIAFFVLAFAMAGLQKWMYRRPKSLVGLATSSVLVLLFSEAALGSPGSILASLVVLCILATAFSFLVKLDYRNGLAWRRERMANVTAA